MTILQEQGEEKRAGIYQKYVVTRTDGEDRPEAEYFVLRLDKDDDYGRACRRTLLHHALQIKEMLPVLSAELRTWVAETELELAQQRGAE